MRFSVKAPGRGGNRSTLVDASSHAEAARLASEVWLDVWRLETVLVWLSSGEKEPRPFVLHRVRGFWLALWNRLTRKRAPLLSAEGFDTSHPSERWAHVTQKGDCPE